MSEWISVNDKRPECCKDIRFWREPHLEFTTVFACDIKSGSVGIRNRVRQIPCGIEYLDKEIKTTEWCWSRDSWVPTHWMPIPDFPKEKEKKDEN